MDFEDSVAALTAKEASKIELALKDLEDLLFIPVPAQEPSVIVETEERDVYRDYMLSAAVGYSAHTEEVAKEEVALWQSQFSYLHVQGEAMLELNPDYEEDNINQREEDLSLPDGSFFHPMTPANLTHDDNEVKNTAEKGSDPLDLRVSGISIAPLSRCRREDGSVSPQKQRLLEEDEEEGEILFAEGQFEETLHVDKGMPSMCPSSDNRNGDEIYTSIEPIHCQQAEVINSLVDVIFPDIVKFALRPFVASVVRAGREHNARFVAEEELPHDSVHGQEEGCEDGMFFSGDDGTNQYPYGDNQDESSGGNNRGGQFLVVPDGWD